MSGFVDELLDFLNGYFSKVADADGPTVGRGEPEKEPSPSGHPYREAPKVEAPDGFISLEEHEKRLRSEARKIKSSHTRELRAVSRKADERIEAERRKNQHELDDEARELRDKFDEKVKAGIKQGIANFEQREKDVAAGEASLRKEGARAIVEAARKWTVEHENVFPSPRDDRATIPILGWAFESIDFSEDGLNYDIDTACFTPLVTGRPGKNRR